MSGNNSEEESGDTKYKAPEKKSIKDIIGQDTADESLARYKRTLLGGDDSLSAVPFPDNKKTVVLKSFTILTGESDENTMNLQDDAALADLKNNPVKLTPGAKYSVRIQFYVQRDLVSGLKYVQKIKRMKISSKETLMMGSFAPRMEPHVWKTTEDEVPSGLLAKGTYEVDSRFVDDDNHEYAAWTWKLVISK